MEIFYHISWRRDSSPGGSCSDTTIANGGLISGEGQLTCRFGCSGAITAMSYTCTDFSIKENWSFGERRVMYNFTDYASGIVTIAYLGGDWISPFNSDWYVPTTFSLTKRNDTGRINSTPRTITAPVIQLQEGCNHTISLAVSDPDNDIIRCRWAEGNNECGGICSQIPGAELDSESCVVRYQANKGARYWAAALMIEDFLPNSSLPLSSVALQFLVLVVSSSAPCSQMPEFISPTIREGACVAIPPGTTFHTQLIAISGDPGASIVEIQTTSPLGTSKSELFYVEDFSAYVVNISWTPEIYQQNETHLFCFIAINSHAQSSKQTCIQLFPGHYPPMPIEATATPNQQLVDPSNTLWNIQFDRRIERPSVVAYISFHEFVTENEVYRIDASLSQEVIFEQSNKLSISPNYLFAEKETFYINFERGIVQNPDACGPGNEPVKAKNFWTFETKDVTPPTITFLDILSVTNANVSFSWESNENVTWKCKVVNGTTEYEVGCSEAYWSGYELDEGIYSLNITATDEAGNTATVIHTFEVDLTPPTISILQKPAQLSNQQTAILRFACNEICSYECKFFSDLVSATDHFSCISGFFYTPTLEHNTSYIFSVTATDQVGNKGEAMTYAWETDFESPHVYGIQNVSVLCSNVSPEHAGQAQATDNRPENLTLTYSDIHLGCSIRRTWTAMDEAGNTALLVQNIGLEYIPAVSLSPQVAIPCDSTASSIQVPTATAAASNPCGLPLHLTLEDSVREYTCPSDFKRTWTVTVCNRNRSFSQTINLYDLCPPHACGRNESTPHGVCILGNCQCNRPWHGENCSVLIYEPKIELINDMVLHEAQEYTSSVILSQGTPPLSWTLLSGPDQLILDQLTGQVTWNRARAGNHTVSVQVENQVGRVQAVWILKVVPGYNTVLSPVFPNIFPRAQPVTLMGHVQYVADNLVAEFLARIVPVHIDISNNGVTRTIQTFTNTDGSFSTAFYPVAMEYGVYIAGARHPGSLLFVPQAEWKFLGMKSTPRILQLNGEAVSKFEKTFYNATVVCNDGPATLQGIMATPLLANSDSLRVQLFPPSDITLEPGENVALDIKVTASRPLNVRFPVVIETTNGTTLQLTVNLQIEPTLPMFLINPPSVNTRVIRGQSRVMEFSVTNVGRAVAHNVQSILPETDVFSFISFGSLQQGEGDLHLSHRESATLSILTQIPANQQLGEITATVIIVSREVSKSLPITLTVSSNVLMNLTVIVEDEYTYFAAGQPLVNNAAVTLINNQHGLRIMKATETGNGSVTFIDILEDRYEIFVEAPSHRMHQQITITSINMPIVTIFIERQAVTYTWSVTPITFKDTYILTIEADFQTHVPIPVVTVTPTEIDLNDLELGFVDSIQFNITNHGLIRANDVNIQLPNDHPFLEFTANTDEFGNLEPLTSITATVQISRKKIEKRYIVWAIYLINIAYSYICGELQFRGIPIVLKKPVETPGVIETSVIELHYPNLPAAGCAGHCSSSSFSFRGYSARTPAFCNKCLQSLFSCVRTPEFPFSGCIPLIAAGKSPLNSVSDAISWILCAVNNRLLGYGSCIYGVYENCLRSGQSKRDNRKRRSLESVVNELLEAMYPVHLSIDLGSEVLGEELWISVEDQRWLSDVLRPALEDRSDVGVLISSTELLAIFATPPPNGTTMEQVAEMVERLNNTLHGWNNGHLEPQEGFNMASFSTVQKLTQEIGSYNEIAKSKGFISYLEAYNFAVREVNKIDRWEEEGGVCAVVRIRIEQELAVTREAFLAKLEIENQEDSPLEQIELEILISDSITGNEATHLFSISNRMLSGSFSLISSTWSLPSEMSGAAEWLIVPYSEAAPSSSRAYDVGGTLFYILDGENITIVLLPTKITVIPDPSLLVHYFWEKNVIGDDPFTDEVEPSVPFTLGVAIRNAGYGTANSLQITSGQPEIIENSKGLLINFMIIGANVGSESMSPSLTAAFGDLAPNTTKVARWFIISSLQGEFKNYSATFENINPLGDPKLSILDELEIHELIRNILIYDSTEEDGILDFLVNDQNDLVGYPDTVYSSKTLQRYDVSAGTVLSVQLISTSSEVVIRTSTNSTGWVYYRYEDTQGLLSETVNVTKQEGNETIPIPPENSWITRLNRRDSMTDIKTQYLHIVDYVETTDEVVFTGNLCSSNCPTVERPFERPVIAGLNSSSAVIPEATTGTTVATSTATLKQSVIVTMATLAAPTPSVGTVIPTEASSEETAESKIVVVISVVVPVAGIIIAVVAVAVAIGVSHMVRAKISKMHAVN